MLRRYVTAVVGRPKLVVASVILITVVLGFFITRIRMLLDVDSQIPPGHPLVIVGKQIVKMFGGKATAYVCANYVCQLPTSDLKVMARLLQARP